MTKSSAGYRTVLALFVLFSHGLAFCGAATLTVGFASISSNSIVNLTSEGATDWIHWGLFTENSIDRKAGVTPLISDFTPLDASNGFTFVYQYADNPNGYSWSDGTPTMSVTNTHTGVWAYGTPAMGSGFQVTVPASTNQRLLKIYVGAYAARAQFTASLSDSSAPRYTSTVNNSVNNLRNGPSAVYSITFAASSPGQTLTVQHTLSSPYQADGNVTLQAAALSAPGVNNPPFATITTPTNTAQFPEHSDIPLAASASDADGSVSLVEFFAGATKVGESIGPAFTATWTNAVRGRHNITARTTDNLGATSTSLPVEIFAYGTGGTLAANRALPATTLNLTAEGTSDWAHWGMLNASNFNHKASGGSQISDIVRLGTNPLQRFADNRTAFSWSDGTPLASTNNANVGIFVRGLGQGFEISAPADTNARTLKVYCGLYGARGHFSAWLNDFSAPAFSDTSISNVFGNSYYVYTLTYSSPSNGQRLLVRYRTQTLYDFDFGNVTLQAATLQGPAAPLPVLLRNPQHQGNRFTFSFNSQSGRNYAAQFTPSLTPVNWQTFTNVPGTGGWLFITNDLDASPQHFYRILTQ